MALSKNELETAIFKHYLVDYPLEVGLSRYTVKSKRETLRRFWVWLKDRPFNADSCKDWVRYLNVSLRYQPASINHEVRVLRAAVRHLAVKGYIDDFAKQIPCPRVHKKVPDIVSAELAEKVVLAGTECGPGDNCLNQSRKNEHRQALRFILRTGLRNRELRDLKGSDINLDNETYQVKCKNGNVEQMPLPKDMMAEVRSRIDRERLFEVTSTTLNICLRRGCRKLGVTTKVTAHILRHIFAAALCNKGVPIQEVSKLMRHSSISITVDRYGHFTIEQLRHSLNGYHPLIKQGLSPEEVIQMVQDAVDSTGVKTDSRIKTETETAPGELLMRFKMLQI